jgi:hypothetical protein
MAEVKPGRFTAQVDGPFVVLRLGIRVNRPFHFWKWIPTLRTTVPLLRGLLRDQVPGLLGGFPMLLYWQSGIGIIQYWRSFEDLERFACSKGNGYQALWNRYETSPGADGSVGLWYETFFIDATRYEAVYDNMPVIGLAAATRHIPVVGRLETARRRLGGQSEPVVPSPPNPVS